jgi:hypothetical protein
MQEVPAGAAVATSQLHVHSIGCTASAMQPWYAYRVDPTANSARSAASKSG